MVARKKQPYETVKAFNEYRATPEGENISGVLLEEEYQRIYPHNTLACHVLGYTVSGNIGTYGIEEAYNNYLNGSSGRVYTYLND